MSQAMILPAIPLGCGVYYSVMIFLYTGYIWINVILSICVYEVYFWIRLASELVDGII